MTLFKIDAVFDINRPWCYIGHTYLSWAITFPQVSLIQKDTFKVALIASYLKPPSQAWNPSAAVFPVPAQSRQKLHQETYGKAHAESVLQNIKQAAHTAGLPLKFNGLTGTTKNGHRLVQHAKHIRGFESAEKTLHDLLKLYHEDEVDITQLEVLRDAGVKNGLGNWDEIEEYLLSGEYGKLVDDMAESHAGSVPLFEVWNDDQERPSKQQVNGAQSDAVWRDIFERVARTDKTSNVL